jgi:hypothetical protein
MTCINKKYILENKKDIVLFNKMIILTFKFIEYVKKHLMKQIENIYLKKTIVIIVVSFICIYIVLNNASSSF